MYSRDPLPPDSPPVRRALFPTPIRGPGCPTRPSSSAALPYARRQEPVAAHGDCLFGAKSRRGLDGEIPLDQIAGAFTAVGQMVGDKEVAQDVLFCVAVRMGRQIR